MHVLHGVDLAGQECLPSKLLQKNVAVAKSYRPAHDKASNYWICDGCHGEILGDHLCRVYTV